ncbi:MAG: hypothetical protein HKN89_00095 [Eudoraea sp.]|nr:hypothetical protein [Eudoraea sp.]
MWDVRFEEDPNDTTTNLADEIVNNLTDQDCSLVSFLFIDDGAMVVTDKISYLEINAAPSGLDVSCPTQRDNRAFFWELDGDRLTMIDENDILKTITIELENDTFITAGENINASNYTGAEAVFTKHH